jgi:hypothetical protein
MNKIKRQFKTPSKSKGGSVILDFDPTKGKSRPGFSDVPQEWQELREKHYKYWLGDLENILVWHEVLPVIPHIDICVFPLSKELNRKFFTLITSGMSDEKMSLPKNMDAQNARAELIFYIKAVEIEPYQTEEPWYISTMRFLAHFPLDYKTWISASHTLPNGNPPVPVVDGSLLTTALFLPPIFEPQEFAHDFRLGNDKVNFLWLTFLSHEETEYKLEYGYGKLVDKFNTDNMPQVFNPFRQSII